MEAKTVHPRPGRRVPVDREALDAAIKASGLSLREVARRADLTAPHLVGVISGKHGISERKLRALNAELSVPYESLLLTSAA